MNCHRITRPAAGQTQWERPSAAAAAAPAPFAAPAAAPGEHAAAGASAGAGGELFYSSPTFVGARPGYVFRLGPSGIGYYKDSPETDRLLGGLRYAVLCCAGRARLD